MAGGDRDLECLSCTLVLEWSTLLPAPSVDILLRNLCDIVKFKLKRFQFIRHYVYVLTRFLMTLHELGLRVFISLCELSQFYNGFYIVMNWLPELPVFIMVQRHVLLDCIRVKTNRI